MIAGKNIILMAQGLLMIAIAASPAYDPGYYDFALLPPVSYKTAGFLMVLTGALVVFYGVFHLRKKFTISAEPQKETTLVTDGPFRYVRNPMYLGGLWMCFGWSVSMDSTPALICSTVLFFVLLMKIRMEEAYLAERFGNEYREYKKRVKKLLPLVY